MANLLEHYEGALVGALVGDCLGAPFEWILGNDYDKTMNKLLKFFRSVDNGKKKGKCEYTDDTAMLRCVANSLVQHKKLDARDLSIREPNRGYGGDIHTVFEQLRDTNFSDPFGPAATQFDGTGSFGNGGAMRIAPAALFGLHFSEMDFNFLLDSQQKFSLTQILNKAASLHRRDQVHSHSNSEDEYNMDDDEEMEETEIPALFQDDLFTTESELDVARKMIRDGKRRDEYWAAGARYGHHNRPEWDIRAFVAAQKERDKQIESVLHKILLELKILYANHSPQLKPRTSYSTVAYSSASSSSASRSEQLVCDSPEGGTINLVTDVYNILEGSALIPFAEANVLLHHICKAGNGCIPKPPKKEGVVVSKRSKERATSPTETSVSSNTDTYGAATAEEKLASLVLVYSHSVVRPFFALDGPSLCADYGTYKIDVKTKIASDMELLTSGSDHHDTGMVTGDMQLKSTVWKDIGLSWSTKWSLENMVSAEVVVEDKLLQGLKLSCDGHFVPLTGHKGWLAGCLLSYDTCRSAMTNFNMAAARTMEDYTIYLAFNNSTQFQSSIYHKVNDKLELGIKKGWSTDNTDTKFSVAAKYSVDKDLILRGKLNNRCQIGLSYQQRVHDAQNLVMNSNNNNDSDSDETDEWECCCCTTANSNADEKCSQCETSRYANLVQPPENWDIPNNGERVSLVTLRTDEAEHQTITCNLESTKTKFSVCQIDRVQNIYLHNLYATMKQHMESDSRRPAIFERTLYHGTDLNSMKIIISEGFDRNLAGRNSTALGRGTYFSVDPGYAMDRQYATPNSDGLQCMLRCSVLTGSFTKGSSQLLQPPKDRNGRVYDSVTERKKNPQMFAVFGTIRPMLDMSSISECADAHKVDF